MGSEHPINCFGPKRLSRTVDRLLIMADPLWVKIVFNVCGLARILGLTTLTIFLSFFLFWWRILNPERKLGLSLWFCWVGGWFAISTHQIVNLSPRPKPIRHTRHGGTPFGGSGCERCTWFVLLPLVCTWFVPLPVCDHSRGVYFPPNRRRSMVFRVL